MNGEQPIGIAMEREGKRDGDNDRISKLPEFLLHQILSHLPPKEAARTTILSKTWLQSYSSSPFLTFDESFFSNSWQMLANRDPFFNFVNNTLLRYNRLNLRIHNLQITLFNIYDPPAYLLLDKSLGVAFHSGVKELDISFQLQHTLFADVEFTPYTLPSAMFDSPKLLTYLMVDRCKFPENVVSNSKSSATIFPFLKTLIINHAYIDDGTLQKLLSSSPSLEKIVFFAVYGFHKFRVCNLDKLKILEIRSAKMIEIDIEDAPSLSLLICWSCSKRPCLLKLGRALQNHNLKHLELYSGSIRDNTLKDLFLKYPLLEHLEIDSCDWLERINIVSDSLKYLKLKCCKNLVEAKIEAPSLLELEYSGENVLSLSLNNTPEELMIYIYLSHYGTGPLSDAWFHQLRELLQSVTRARFSFSLWRLCIEFDTSLDFKEYPLPLTQNYMPEMNPSSSLFAVFVNTLFSCSRPTSIHSCSLLPTSIYFMRFLSNELITATRNSNCCGSDDQTKCWRHYLKDINVEVYEDSQNVWQPLPHEALQSEDTFYDSMIRFSLTCFHDILKLLFESSKCAANKRFSSVEELKF